MTGIALALHIGQIMFPMVLIVGIGLLVSLKQAPSLGSMSEINLNVFIPALVFSSLIEQQFNFQQYAFLAMAGVCLVLLTMLFAHLFARLLNTQFNTLAPTMMFHNAGNIGLPLMTLALGPDGLAAAVILFLIGNIMHFGLGTYMLDKRARWQRSLSSPAILAAIIAVSLQSQSIRLDDYLLLPMQMLGSIAVPLMLFSLGVQLAQANLTHWKLGTCVGFLSPLTGVGLALMLAYLLPLDNLQTAALVLFGALPPAVMNFLFAQRYQQEPDKVSAIVMLGNSIAIFTLPIALLYVLPNYT